MGSCYKHLTIFSQHFKTGLLHLIHLPLKEHTACEVHTENVHK